MKYIVEAFDKITDALVFKVPLPDDCEEKLAEIMDWTAPQRGDEGYDLTTTQLSRIEALANQSFTDENHVFQLTCNDY